VVGGALVQFPGIRPGDWIENWARGFVEFFPPYKPKFRPKGPKTKTKLNVS